MIEQLDDSFAILSKAQPIWRADQLGVRGNPIEFHKEQAKVNWPAAEITERAGGIKVGPAKAGLSFPAPSQEAS